MSATSSENKFIIIGGAERSGTSLLRAIIGSHPQIAIFQRDLPLWNKYYDLYHDLDLKKPQKVKRLVSEITSNYQYRMGLIQIDTQMLIQRILEMPAPTIGLVNYTFLRLYADEAGRPICGLKTPYIELNADVIFDELPRTYMIHLVRDPRDTAASFKKFFFSIRKKYNVYDQINRWRQAVLKGLESQDKYPGRYLMVRYEDLIDDPYKFVTRLCEFLNVPYSDDMLLMEGHPGWKGTNTSFRQNVIADKKIFREPVGRYKQHLSAREISLNQLFLGDLMEHFGYLKIESKPVNPATAKMAYRLTIAWKEFIHRYVLIMQRSFLYRPFRFVYRNVKGLTYEKTKRRYAKYRITQKEIG